MRHLNQIDLARRWTMSPRTLQTSPLQRFAVTFVSAPGEVDLVEMPQDTVLPIAILDFGGGRTLFNGTKYERVVTERVQ